jgi:hypothetical protein
MATITVNGLAADVANRTRPVNRVAKASNGLEVSDGVARGGAGGDHGGEEGQNGKEELGEMHFDVCLND